MNIVENNPCHVTFFEPIGQLKYMNGVYKRTYKFWMVSILLNFSTF